MVPSTRQSLQFFIVWEAAPKSTKTVQMVSESFVSYPLNNVIVKIWLSYPMLLVWGDLDPWMGPSKCDQLKELYLKATMVRLQAGHCSHDEVPEQANKVLLDFEEPWLGRVLFWCNAYKIYKPKLMYFNNLLLFL